MVPLKLLCVSRNKTAISLKFFVENNHLQSKNKKTKKQKNQCKTKVVPALSELRRSALNPE